MELQREAKILASYDAILNVRTKERVEAMQELADVQKESRELKKAFLEEIFDELHALIAEQGEIDHILRRNGAPSKKANEIIEQFDKWRDLKNDFQTALEGFKTGTFDAEYWVHTSERLSALVIEIQKQAKELGGTDPEVANYLNTRTTALVGFACTAGKLVQHHIELAGLQRLVSTVNDSMGDAAPDLEKIRKARAEHQKRYDEKLRQLQELK
jgi:hypothetical protein